MKEVFVSLSRYNRNVNNVISAYVAEMDKKKLTKKHNTHYPSLLDNLIHVMQSDARWLQRMSEFLPETQGEDAIPDGFSVSEDDKRIFSEHTDQLVLIRSKMDDMIVGIAENIPSERYTADFEMQFGSKKINKTLWKLLLQWFNHHTHHRGQISVLLDYLGIENDFSLVLDKIEQ